MEFYDLIKSRESIRDYDPNKPVNKEVLTRILEAGRLAPSASNRQAWTFVVVSSPEKLEAVRPCYPRKWFKQAPHILVIIGNKAGSWVRSYDGYNSIETDLAIAMDHIILAAENEGVGTCWIIAYDYELLAKAMDLKKDEVIFCITPLGYPHDGFQKKNQKIRKPFEEVVRFI
ncbi:MAG: nitroreductase family protein [Bacteroidales bacterium]|nr:nitroreductase family protein [Bacteroidales bacterium]